MAVLPARAGGGVLSCLLLAASARLYGALLVLYPKAFRYRYSEEMQRDFLELLREGLQEGGATELVRVLAQAHSDLVLTALKERSTTAARRYASYLSVDPRIAARTAARAMVAVVLVAVGVSWASFLQTPTYETPAHVLVAFGERDGRPRPIPKDFVPFREIGPTMLHFIDSRP